MTDIQIVKKMILLRRWGGKILQASSHGDFSGYFPKFFNVGDGLFELKHDNHYATIMGVFPSIPYKHIENKNKLKGFDKNTNLYVFCINKCLDHLDQRGELIVHTPSDFLKNSPALNERLFKMGTITDIINTDKVGYIIWRFVKDDFSHKTLFNGEWKNFLSMNNQLMFLNNDYSVPFTDLFTIHVGAISGCDEAFSKGNSDFVTSQTLQSGLTKKMLFNSYHISLEKYKDKLLSRKVKKFNEDNWWTWGRSHFISDEPRVYVPCKTKQDKPFFNHDCKNYDGSVMGIFFKGKAKPAKVASLLNKVDWAELGFKTGKRFIFSQKSLESINLPTEFRNTFH
jgi:adenine-specific DNA-methyltransferase